MEPYALLAMTGLFVVTFVSPGPDTFLVVQARLCGGSGSSNAVVAGIAVADLAWGFGAVLGIAALLARVPQLVALSQLAGGTWLFVIGLRSFGRPRTPAPDATVRRGVGFGDGFVSSGLNPSQPILFAVAMPSLLEDARASVPEAAAVAVLYAGLGTLWFSTVAALTARGRRRASGGRLSRMLERVPGLVLMGFGYAFVAAV